MAEHSAEQRWQHAHTAFSHGGTRQFAAASCPNQLAPAAAEQIPRSTAAAAAVTVSGAQTAVCMHEMARVCAALPVPCLLVC